MGDGLGSTDMLASATHLLPTAPRCRAMQTPWEEGPDPRIFTCPYSLTAVGQCVV